VRATLLMKCVRASGERGMSLLGMVDRESNTIDAPLGTTTTFTICHEYASIPSCAAAAIRDFLP